MSNAESRAVGSYIDEAGRAHTVAVTRLAKSRYTIVDRAEDGSARTVETLAEFDARGDRARARARLPRAGAQLPRRAASGPSARRGRAAPRRATAGGRARRARPGGIAVASARAADARARVIERAGNARRIALSHDQQVALYARLVHGGGHGLVELAAAHRRTDGGLVMRRRHDPRRYLRAGNERALVEAARRDRAGTRAARHPARPRAGAARKG